MKIALAQINPLVGDIRGNLAKIRAWTARAARQKADLVVFPELSITGYPPRDLVEQKRFVEKNKQAVQELAQAAAFSDPRFRPVEEAEMQAIDVEISVLTPPQDMPYKDADDLLKKLPLLGKDLDEYSLETVRMFHRDAAGAGYRL